MLPRLDPGHQYIMDGYVSLCKGCQKEVTDSHQTPGTVWAGVPIIQPLDGIPIEILKYGYVDDARVAATR